MKITRTLVTVSILAAASPSAFAQDSDCFPACAEAQPAAVSTPALDLCRHGAVREAVRIEKDLRPVKELYGIAINPTGFVIKQVSERTGVRVPKWVGYAMDPKGAVRNKVMERVRAEAKKATGLGHDCAAESAEPEEEAVGPLPQPEADEAVVV